jgi:hypothetical protein
LKAQRPAKYVWSFSDFCRIASRHESDFADMGTVVSQGKYEGATYTFKDNGSAVLAIAHVDTVQSSAYASIFKCKGEQVLLCPRLDDRLGVYVITRMLPAMGITCDLLLTTGEEVGCSSAELFIAEKDYNWCFSFDRSGTDVVLYQHDTKRLRRVMRKNGFVVGDGSFSDISSLDIGCAGVNFGVGYYDAHGLHAYAKLSETFRMVDKFAGFYAKYANARLPFDPGSRLDTMSGWRRSWKSGYGAGYHNRGYVEAAYEHYGRNGYESVTYPPGEVIWDRSGNKMTKGEMLDFYARHDEWDETQPLDGETPDEQLERLADEASRHVDDGR